MGHVAQVPHLLDPLLVAKQGELALQHGRHLLGDLHLCSPPIHFPCLVEVPPQLQAHLAGHPSVTHEPIEIVHGLLEVHLVGLHRGDDPAHRADHVRPDACHHGRAQGCNPVLQHCLGCDVAVADASEADDGPIQRKAVHMQRTFVKLLWAPLRLAQSGQPSVMSGRHQTEMAPQASHPMAGQEDNGKELDQSQERIAEAEVEVVPVHQLLQASKPQQSHEPKQAQDM
mmetsp:Transcript_15497/g.38719  ORF Transcript_15497/g.38719 Transcript_15497/m.38719 type:complete len:228 (+) Transcript_15497:979-1662(+)